MSGEIQEAARGGTPRQGEKSAEVIEKKRFVRPPLRERVRKSMNGKGIVEMVEGEKATEKNPSTPEGRSGCTSLAGCAVRNPLKRKDLNVKKEEMEKAQGEKAGIGDQQTRERIA